MNLSFARKNKTKISLGDNKGNNRTRVMTLDISSYPFVHEIVS